MITSINEWRKINEEVDEIPVLYGTDDNKNLTNIEFFTKLFEFRQIAHDIHLTKSVYSEHMALGEFYDSLLLLIDNLFETYQGQYGLVEDYKTSINYNIENDIVETFEIYTKSIQDTYKGLFEQDSHLLNICDEIVALCYKTIYKLKYLK